MASLRDLYCHNNLLTSLDVSDNTNLYRLWCQNNLIEDLILSNDVGLRILHCANNQLTSLDISTNTLLSGLDLRGMPTLEEVCVWTMPFPPEGYSVNLEGSPNVFFTTDCSK